MKNRFVRLATIGLTAFGFATGLNFLSYLRYWKGTIFAVQTVDFNILSHTLPTKLSYTLQNGDIKELQETINSNYRKFGLVVTDCKTQAKDCSSQHILYSSDSSRSWKKNLQVTDLSQHPYDILRNPPPLVAEGQYEHAYDSEPKPTGKTNQGEIIGRVYYIRGVPPSFIEDYSRWITNLFDIGGVRLIYSLTSAFFLVGGLAFWVVLEAVLYKKRIQKKLAEQTQIQLTEELNKWQSKLNSALKEIALLLSERERERDELRRYQEEQHHRIQHFEQAFAQQQQIINQLESQLAQQKARQQRYEEAIALIESQLAQEKARQQRDEEAIALIESHLSEQKARKQRDEKAIAIIENQLAEKDRESAKLRKNLNDARQQEATAKTQLEKLNESIKDLIIEKKKLTVNIESLQRENADLRITKTALQELEEEHERTWNENIRLKRELEDAELRSLKNEERVLELKRQIEQHEENWLLVQGYPLAEESEEQAAKGLNEEGRNFRTVLEALEAAEQQFADAIAVWESAKQAASQSRFARPQSVYLALTAIAEVSRDYFKAIETGNSMGPWKTAFAKHMSCEYAPTESETTLQLYGHMRDFRNGGQTCRMLKHLKLGKHDAVNCLRIYFEPDEGTKKINIGYCGKHLPCCKYPH